MPRIFLGSCLWSCILRVSRPFVTALAFACVLVLALLYYGSVMFLLRVEVVGVELASP